MRNQNIARCWSAAALAVLVAVAQPARAQSVIETRAEQASAAGGEVTSEWRSRGLKMLADMREELRKNYYDTTFGGRDMLGANYTASVEAVRNAPTRVRMFGAIASYMVALEDSHTRFLPPALAAKIEYGFVIRFVGDSAYVWTVKAGSDAAQKGVRPGDLVLGWDTFTMSRESWPTIRYVYYGLSPRGGINLRLRSPLGVERTVLAVAKVTVQEQTIDLGDQTSINRWIQRMDDEPQDTLHLTQSVGSETGVLYWRMRSFEYADDPTIDGLMKRAKEHQALVLDLRGNEGGSIDLLLYLIGKFTDRPLTVGRVNQRRHIGKETELIARPTDRSPYRGRLVILMDSESGSSSEILARTLQLTGRAAVVGDRSAGQVMGARIYPHRVGGSRQVEYAAYISVTELVMPDGGRLEKSGVIPDHRVLLTGADIAARRDPQLAKALELLGITIGADEAGQISHPRKR